MSKYDDMKDFVAGLTSQDLSTLTWVLGDRLSKQDISEYNPELFRHCVENMTRGNNIEGFAAGWTSAQRMVRERTESFISSGLGELCMGRNPYTEVDLCYTREIRAAWLALTDKLCADDYNGGKEWEPSQGEYMLEVHAMNRLRCRVDSINPQSEAEATMKDAHWGALSKMLKRVNLGEDVTVGVYAEMREQGNREVLTFALELNADISDDFSFSINRDDINDDDGPVELSDLIVSIRDEVEFQIEEIKDGWLMMT